MKTPAHWPSDVEPLTFMYINHRGETAERRVKPLGCRFGTNEYYTEPQWLMYAWDVDRKAMREFAFKRMKLNG